MAPGAGDEQGSRGTAHRAIFYSWYVLPSPRGQRARSMRRWCLDNTACLPGIMRSPWKESTGSVSGSENPLASQAAFCDPRKFQGNTVSVLQDKATPGADGHEAGAHRVLWLTQHPLPPCLPSQRTGRGISQKQVPKEDIWCLLAKKEC